MPQVSSSIQALPICRFTEKSSPQRSPFTHIGIDFAGPLYVKKARRSSQENDSDSDNAYACLYTWTSTWAVHLELTQGLTVQDFLLAFLQIT